MARETEILPGEAIYEEKDPADALYMVVEGRVRLSAGGKTTSEVGPGEAFGTWSLVDDSERGHRAECIEEGLLLALHRDEFYDVAAGDLTLLQEVVRVLAKRLRALVAVSERPEEARVEGEGIAKPEAMEEIEAAAAESPAGTVPATPGEALKAAALGQPAPEGEAPQSPREPDIHPKDFKSQDEKPETPPA